MELDFTSLVFWLAVGQIVLIDIVLSGDNAVVIALACRELPDDQRRRGIFWGVLGAVLLRVVLTIFAARVMDVPWVKLVGAVLLLWIAIKLLLPEDDDGHAITPAEHLWGAIRTIVIADAVMSLDNVIGVAAASGGSLALLVFGLVLSIPLMVWASQLIMRWMDRWPALIIGGAALLGYVAGAMVLSDPVVVGQLHPFPAWLEVAAGAAGALLVVVSGQHLARRMARNTDGE